MRFCKNYEKKILPAGKIINCPPVETLDDLPYPDYSDYFAQVAEHDLEEDVRYVNLESSRGAGGRMHLIAFSAG